MCDNLDNGVPPAKRMRIGLPTENRPRDTTNLAYSGSLFHNSLVFDEHSYSSSLDVNSFHIPSSLTQWEPASLSPGALIPSSEMILPVFDLGDSFEYWTGTSSVHNSTAQPSAYSASNIPGMMQTPDLILQSQRPASADSTTSLPLVAKQQSPTGTEVQLRDQPTQQSAPLYTNPFTECANTFGSYLSLQFTRPADGKVNSYVKFNWVRPTSKRKIQELADDEISSAGSVASVGSQLSECGPSPLPKRVGKSNSASPISKVSVSTTSPEPRSGAPHPTSMETPYSAGTSLACSSKQSYTLDANAPQLIPAHFGHESILDTTGRKLWRFYINNWCPGRSVLKRTNPWVADFARLEGLEGVTAAVQSLAGVYIYDYQPADVVKHRVNQSFLQAEGRLAQLIDLADSLDSGQVAELVTISAVLSMQDIVLVERRRKRPNLPRWLEGFQLCEHFLRKNDNGSRFWHKEHVQTDSLHMSQTVIVGRGLILAQPMMALSSPDTFDYLNEAARFNWLLYGSEKDAFEIHGGCGFSKRLLHAISQVTCFAARLQQEPKSILLPRMASQLKDQIMNMRQWSPESISFTLSQKTPQPIVWVRQVNSEYRISTPGEMTDVTAEAWRLGVMLYLQCRLLRLPRNHSDVLANLDDLAKCITIMPTEGSCFTAQAPLFPVFLLGLLGTAFAHKAVATGWFETVTNSPVRSSVLPLYASLKRITPYLDKCADGFEGQELPERLADRVAWWEQVILWTEEQESEVLCLT